MIKKCPRRDFKPCLGGECALYVELYRQDLEKTSNEKIGNCAEYWLPLLLIEFKQELIKLKKGEEARE